MNKDIQHRLRMLYRQVERGIKPAVDKISEENMPIEPDTIRNEILSNDAEVINESELLVDAILEDIADPGRCDSFSEFEEEALETAKKIVSDEPGLFYRSDWEKEVARRVAESNDFFDLTVDMANKKALDVMHSKEAFDAIQDMLRDQADLEEMRKDPHSYHGVSEKNIVGV